MKRGRVILLIAAMAAAFLLASGTALALDKACLSGGFTCNGTSGNDLLIGTDGAELINGFVGNDQFVGNGGDDTFNATTASNAGAGSDTYIFSDGFGQDTLNDTGSASDKDTVDFSKVSSGMNIWAVPEETDPTYNHNSAWVEANPNTKVKFDTTTTIEKIVGSAGSNSIEGGKQTITYDLRAGGSDTVLDFGGWPGNSVFPALPASNDTYIGYKSGSVAIEDNGGSGDILDLKPRKSTDVSFRKTGSVDLELILGPGANDKIRILGYFGSGKR